MFLFQYGDGLLIPLLLDVITLCSTYILVDTLGARELRLCYSNRFMLIKQNYRRQFSVEWCFFASVMTIWNSIFMKAYNLLEKLNFSNYNTINSVTVSRVYLNWRDNMNHFVGNMLNADLISLFPVWKLLATPLCAVMLKYILYTISGFVEIIGEFKYWHFMKLFSSKFSPFITINI